MGDWSPWDRLNFFIVARLLGMAFTYCHPYGIEF